MIYFGGDKRIVQARLPSEKGNSLIVNYGNNYKEPEGCSSTTTTDEDALGNFERRCDGWVFVWVYIDISTCATICRCSYLNFSNLATPKAELLSYLLPIQGPYV